MFKENDTPSAEEELAPNRSAYSGTIEVVNFGCRLNSYEGEIIKQQAQAAGLQDAIIFNSCAVTAEAERQVRQAVRRARKAHPDAKIIVTGCSAQVHPDMYAEMPEVDKVIGNQEKLEKRGYEFALARGEKALVNDIMSVQETASHLVTSFEGRARAFVQVQNGCNHRCTFCIIPYGRGNSRSVPMGEVVSQVRTLVEVGFKEVVLTGVDISDYGSDLPGAPSLGQMMRRLLALVPELPRLRLSSIDAVEVDEDLYRLIAEEPRLMPHMHISLQAGDDMVLKRMKRRHLREDALAFCRKVRTLRPDMVFGADIIAGFPTETDEMFANTLRLVEEADLMYLHVFPYSARKGTPAAKMPQVPMSVRKDRAAQLRAAGEAQLQRYLQTQPGQLVEILMEKDALGRNAQFAQVRLDKACEPGSLVQARITATDGKLLHGVVVQ
ncbi:MAG: tRNA (N(6)-L-threonylcarbamoyladenosine(37)-C(2))-methylthiotransferase MtaB [Rickettsiales bacterium]|nr:tRNA (N(6)-L-threonylcarbamoyladenosine(37)-C(2))-methylthiotransferase MtaB [Rickettsiales bacterium]